MRRFLLVRDEDVSGVSGVGMVAEGVQFSNGKSVLNWTTQYKSTAVYDSIEELDAIHGHNGRTRIVWLNEAEEAEITAWRNDFHALREDMAMGMTEEQKIVTVARHTPWPVYNVQRFLSCFPRLTVEQAIAAIRAAEAHAAETQSIAQRDDLAWVYAYQLAAYVTA